MFSAMSIEAAGVLVLLIANLIALCLCMSLWFLVKELWKVRKRRKERRILHEQ